MTESDFYEVEDSGKVKLNRLYKLRINPKELPDNVAGNHLPIRPLPHNQTFDLVGLVLVDQNDIPYFVAYRPDEKYLTGSTDDINWHLLQITPHTGLATIKGAIISTNLDHFWKLDRKLEKLEAQSLIETLMDCDLPIPDTFYDKEDGFDLGEGY